jgi:hypothetical protein
MAYEKHYEAALYKPMRLQSLNISLARPSFGVPHNYYTDIIRVVNDLTDHKLNTIEHFSKIDTTITNLESSLNAQQQTISTDLFQQLADQQKYVDQMNDLLADQHAYNVSLKKELVEQEIRVTTLTNQLDFRAIQIDKLIKKSQDRKKKLAEQETQVTTLTNQLDSHTIQIDELIKKSKDRKKKYTEDMHLMQSNIEALATIVERFVNHTQHKQ